ncbi:hypothetical protein C8R44DRAFT_811657 [Mycena epipterygia]|nr:hypothetical protein C8R44DRAFT_811657 [Mycena epipterygia]
MGDCISTDSGQQTGLYNVLIRVLPMHKVASSAESGLRLEQFELCSDGPSENSEALLMNIRRRDALLLSNPIVTTQLFRNPPPPHTMILTESLASRSGRLILAPPPSELDDAPMASLHCHPQTRRYMPSRNLFSENYTPQDARDRRIARAFDAATVDFSIYAVTPDSESPPKFIGTAALLRVDNEFKSCDTDILDPEWFREGVATEALQRVLTYALEERELHRVAFQTGSHIGGHDQGWVEGCRR